MSTPPRLAGVFPWAFTSKPLREIRPALPEARALIEGVTLDRLGVPVAQRLVRAYRRRDGRLVSETRSQAAGVFRLAALPGEEHQVVGLDDTEQTPEPDPLARTLVP